MKNNKCTSSEMEWLQLLAAGSSACAQHQKEQLSIVLIQGGGGRAQRAVIQFKA